MFVLSSLFLYSAPSGRVELCSKTEQTTASIAVAANTACLW